MKIITWNCRNNFTDKADYICTQKPDILIIPECEKIDIEKFKKNIPQTNSVFWFGDNFKKGVGVFSFADFRMETLEIYNPAFKYVIPIKVQSKTGPFLLLAVWTHIPYVKQLLNAIEYYNDLLKKHTTIIAGDFNSN